MATRAVGSQSPLALAVALSLVLAAPSISAAASESAAARPPVEGYPPTTSILARVHRTLLDVGWRTSLVFTDGASQVGVREETVTDPMSILASGQGAARALPRWDGGVNLYRPGIFSTQKTWFWCTSAGAQMMRNIVHGTRNHSRAQQRRIFSYMRARNRYAIPLADGVDPAGWAAGLRRWVDPRYRIVSKRSFKGALRSAVTRLRKTNLPVAIAVAHGTHAWVLTGFTATADPARTTRFKVRSVRVSGPLWGLQSRSYGYDMRPNTRLTPGQLKGFFTPWHYPRVPMVWEGRWVSIQPVPTS